MSKLIKILSALFSVVIILSAWSMYTTVSFRLQAEQDRLLAYARECVENKIYDRGVSAFLDAIKVGVGDSASIMYELAKVYEQADALPKYRGVLQELIDEASAPMGMDLGDVYEEAAAYDLQFGGVGNALNLLKEGITKTDALQLINLYEENRYVTINKSGLYEEAGIIINGSARVMRDGLWGFVDGGGSRMLEPEYDLATQFYNYAVVQQDGELFVINRRGVRQAVGNFLAEDMASFDGASFSVRPRGAQGYVMANWTSGDEIYITKNDTEYQYIGLASDGIRAIKKDGKWALLDRGSRKESVASEYIYEDIARDELGRCAINGALFVKENGRYSLLSYDGLKHADTFEDAKPFFEENGLAAVKRGGKWGFVNKLGEVVIDFRYDGADSSSMGLAPVQKNGLWGYLSVREHSWDKEIIPPQYLGAKQFVNGCAPVMGEDGWYYIMLAEYES